MSDWCDAWWKLEIGPTAINNNQICCVLYAPGGVCVRICFNFVSRLCQLVLLYHFAFGCGRTNSLFCSASVLPFSDLLLTCSADSISIFPFCVSALCSSQIWSKCSFSALKCSKNVKKLFHWKKRNADNQLQDIIFARWIFIIRWFLFLFSPQQTQISNVKQKRKTLAKLWMKILRSHREYRVKKKFFI